MDSDCFLSFLIQWLYCCARHYITALFLSSDCCVQYVWVSISMVTWLLAACCYHLRHRCVCVCICCSFPEDCWWKPSYVDVVCVNADDGRLAGWGHPLALMLYPFCVVFHVLTLPHMVCCAVQRVCLSVCLYTCTSLVTYGAVSHHSLCVQWMSWHVHSFLPMLQNTRSKQCVIVIVSLCE